MLEERVLITKEHPKSPFSEAYRTLRTNIQFSDIDKEIKTLLFTSSGPGEGKSTVIANYAVTLAQNEKKVLLVDADLRKPKAHIIFNVPNISGITNVLSEGIDYKTVVQSTNIKGLDILVSGPIPSNPSELLGSDKMELLLEEIRNDYDMIVIDSPSVGFLTDAALLSNIVDGTILVCAVREAMKETVLNAKLQLEKANANILGVVLNKIPINEGGYYKYHYYEYIDEEEKESRKRRRKKVST